MILDTESEIVKQTVYRTGVDGEFIPSSERHVGYLTGGIALQRLETPRQLGASKCDQLRGVIDQHLSSLGN